MSDPPSPRDPAPAGDRDPTEPLPAAGPPTADRDVADRTGRRGAWWQWAVLAAVVAALGVLAADAALRSTVEARASEEAGRELGAEVDVRLRGFAAGLRSLTGQVAGVDVHGADVPLPGSGATMSELRLSLHEVRVDRDAGRLAAARAEVEATLDGEAIEGLIGLPGAVPGVELELRPGTLRLRVAGFAVADATVRVDGGALVFALAAPLDRLVPGELRVDEFPLGLRPSDVTVRDGELLLHGEASPLVIGGDGG